MDQPLDLSINNQPLDLSIKKNDKSKNKDQLDSLHDTGQDNSIESTKEHQLLIENDKDLIKEGFDLRKNRLNRYVDEQQQKQQYQQNKQQHQQYQLNQQNNLYNVNQNVQNPVIQPVNNIQYQIYQLNNNCSQQQIYSNDGYKINLNPVYVKPYYLDQNSVLIYPQANVNPSFRNVTTKSDADCQLMKPPAIIQRSNAVIQNRIENYQISPSCSNENNFNNHENNVSSLIKTPLNEIHNNLEFNEHELIDSNRCPEIIYHQQDITDNSIDLINSNAKRTKSTNCSPNKKLKKSSNNDELQQESIDIPKAFKRLPENLANQYFKDDQNSVLIDPQANVNPSFCNVSTKSDADCQLIETPAIIQKSNAIIQNPIENYQVIPSCSNENIFNDHENNVSSLVKDDQNLIISKESTTSSQEANNCVINYDSEIDTKILKILKNNFKLDKFINNQKAIIKEVINKHDCFVLMPTGSGKSICYQLPAVLSNGITIVISPLKSLIQDQIQKLNSLNIAADTLTKDICIRSENEIYDDLYSEQPAIKLLYLTPEKINTNSEVKQLLNHLNEKNLLERVVFDEAHCISEWGHDFRPEYLKLSHLKKIYNVQIVTCTATATRAVKDDLIEKLNMKNISFFIQTFHRPNILFSVIIKEDDSKKQILNEIKLNFLEQSGIIYCFTKKECDELSKFLNDNGIKSRSYHSDISDLNRRTVLNNWMNNQIKVVCATIAFGMGIDKADVRFVFHFTMPQSIENYIQEMGRGGRDGLNCTSKIFFAEYDHKRIKAIIKQDVRKQNRLNLIYNYCKLKNCRLSFITKYIEDDNENENRPYLKCHQCDNCTK